MGDIKCCNFASSWFDLLIGGSPCQDLSIAKKDRKGLDGERSGLFWEYVRVLKEVKPKYFILENVNSMPKEARETITKELFGIEPVMINAALVSAQNRKRLFWVGKLVGDTYEKIEIPQPEDRGILLKDIIEDGSCDRLKSYCIDANYFKGGKIGGTHQSSTRNYTIRIGQIGKGGQADRVYSVDGKSVNLSANGGGRGAKTGLYLVQCSASRTKSELDDRALESEEKLWSKNGDMFGMQDGEKNRDTSQERRLARQQPIEFRRDLSELSHYTPQEKTKVQSGKLQYDSSQKRLLRKAQSEIQEVRKPSYDSLGEDFTVRKLTCIECERLQGLPDGYTEGVSNTQRYKCLGNAFNVDVVSHILTNLERD